MFAIETANSELMPLSLIVTFSSKGFPYRCLFEEFIIVVIYFLHIDEFECSFHWMIRIAWWSGSVVKTSVCGWRTFPDLRLIYG